jgi:signal transduction histidine kinase
VKIRRPSGLTLVTCALLVLLPTLAVLQYRWLGQVSVAERERMQRNLRNAAAQFRHAFDTEIVGALIMLPVGPTTAQNGSSEQYSDRYDTWLNTASHPQFVSAMYLIDADAGALRLRRWNTSTHIFDSTDWPERLQRWRPTFDQALRDFSSPRGFDRRGPMVDDESLMVAPMRNGFRGEPGLMPAEPQPFGFTVLELDIPFMRAQMVPELAQRHFSLSDPEGYRIAVVNQANPEQVLYRSDPDAPLRVDQADATVSLFGPSTQFPRRRGAGGALATTLLPLVNVRGSDDPQPAAAVEDIGRWRLLALHRSGSLEAAVQRVRYRNLAISFGALMLLTGSVALLSVTSRRAQRLAQQQMEFVAGVSHELRTPVAVIRSAGENLSQGVVGSPERVKRYGQMIESESRRLGEMVERVLQYAGLESGLGIAARVPLDPETIVEEAIDSAITLVGPDEVTIERHIAENLPPVSGDAAALRSAVQNLIANAVKYGGPDRWVGVKAEHVRGRRQGEVRVTITDHGPGIPTAELPHIFEPFYRGADAVARQIHGNGLGLSLVKQIVAAHGGTVAVSTRAGAGSAFTISLPAAEPDAQPSAVSNLRAAAHG